MKGLSTVRTLNQRFITFNDRMKNVISPKNTKALVYTLTGRIHAGKIK
jgi:hypothetical protein